MGCLKGRHVTRELLEKLTSSHRNWTLIMLITNIIQNYSIYIFIYIQKTSFY